MKRIKSLDGIRAIAVIMVILSHAKSSIPNIITSTYAFKIVSNGRLGVLFFFSMSGYLITKLLIIEKNKFNDISLKDFYLRRMLRIFPVFYLYIIVILTLKLTIIPNIFTNYLTIIFAISYLWNYKQFFSQSFIQEETNIRILGHFWSLALEEQFYFLWPLFFKKFEIKKLIKCVVIICSIMPFVRILSYFVSPSSRGQMGGMLHTGSDTILIGCLGAMIEEDAFFKQKIRNIIFRKWFVPLISLFLFFINPYLYEKLRGGYNLLIGSTLESISIFILIYYSVSTKNKFTLFLNSKWVIKIGVFSYSLYVGSNYLQEIPIGI
jgi:peptidoglycan/LPS O-acetylase OafA/YrhL